ncbi:energy transducer TonB [Candidatus Uhrbacteria bacterium]|nr:energy transducer TonB [Candidatus Uhrbacteria bacterium]
MANHTLPRVDTKIVAAFLPAELPTPPPPPLAPKSDEDKPPVNNEPNYPTEEPKDIPPEPPPSDPADAPPDDRIVIGDPREIPDLTPPPPPPPAPKPVEPVPVGGNIKPPQRLEHVLPEYPAIARTARVQGIVIIQATINETGLVVEAEVLRSIPLLDQAALDAVRQWRYMPTLLNGKPVPVVMTVTVQFTLR